MTLPVKNRHFLKGDQVGQVVQNLGDDQVPPLTPAIPALVDVDRGYGHTRHRVG
jgi:hypothetical protein